MEPLILIQARMGATRLPGKVLTDLCGKTVLQHIVERVRVGAPEARIVVATTVEEQDDAIEEETKRIGADCFRGSESDVLNRFDQAAEAFPGDPIVRVTADCPLLDPELLAAMLADYSRKKTDYLSNTLERTYPRGLDLEIFPRDVLHQAHLNAHKAEEREHVTPYIYRNPDLFTLRNFAQEEDQSSLRWTLDTPEDLRFIEEIYKALHDNDKMDNQPFTTAQVLDLLKEKPELSAINAGVQQKGL